MAINQNHLFEELNGVKCAIAEKNVSKERADFLKQILEYNHYEVIVAVSPPPKAASVKSIPAVAPGQETIPEAAVPVPLPVPETFTVGVTDVTFNPINAIFGRLLKVPGEHIVTLAYWQQKENYPRDEVPYFSKE